MALARAVTITPPNKPAILNVRLKVGEAKFKEMALATEIAIKQGMCEYPNYGEVCKEILKVGDDHHKLKSTCHIRLFIPVKPMLAKPTKGV